jgi:NitT/TauT family transport system ATP-binding protein
MATLRVLDGVSLSFEAPSINMLLGASGCGKSTLLRMLGGVRPWNVKSPTSGRVEVEGRACEGPHPDAVMVFQHYANRPDLTVWQNVMYPFTFAEWKRRVPAAEAAERVNQMLQEVGLADKRDQYPAQLSGGQNQRVALARALVLRPKVLLMDEPFGALDAQTRANMQALLCRLHAAHPCVIVFVTHDVTRPCCWRRVIGVQPARAGDRDFNIGAPATRQWLMGAETRLLRTVVGLRATGGHEDGQRMSAPGRPKREFPLGGTARRAKGVA